jgi:RNA polymerase sigma-70 factor (ECF subfamily)
MSGDAEMAQEAVQEAFLRYYVTRRKGSAIHEDRSWLYRTTRNLVLDRLKECSFRNRATLGAASCLTEEAQDPETPLVQREIASRVLEGLSPRELECLRLRQDGLHYKEIAEVLDIDSGTVGALLARGLKKIRAALGPGGKNL